MHRTAFYKLLAGERPNLSTDVLFRLADALGVDANHFRPFVTSRLANEPAQAPDDAPPEVLPAVPRGKRK